ncbi:MAG: flagellar assembly protein FliW [Actinomycetota bacterium]|nr:flagellar assembly protein FliW [Actinomycetota bacterium]
MTQIESTRFGTVEVEADAVLEFPTGLIGLGGTRFVLVAPEADSAFVWLHSLEDPSLALPVTRPWSFFPDYEVALSDEETSRLGFPEGVEPDVWVTVRATDQLENFSANLKAPILVCEGRAFQVINEVPDAPVRAALFPAAAEVAAN